MSLGCAILLVRNLAECMQVEFDAGAKHILLLMSNVIEIATVQEAVCQIQTSFYSDPVDVVFKALSAE